LICPPLGVPEPLESWREAFGQILTLQHALGPEL